MNTAIKNELYSLSIEEKIILVEDLWDSIAESSENAITLTSKQKEILENRLENYRNNPNTAMPWSDLKKKITDKHNL